MVDEEALRAIAGSVEVTPQGALLEIGPGLGFLTRLLAQKTDHLVAVEKDRTLAAYLSKKFSGQSVKIVQGDILKIDLASLFAGPAASTAPFSQVFPLLERGDPVSASPANNEAVVVVGNIPYNITSQILEWLILHRRIIKQAALTLQWEVAERLLARPGNKVWGSLSIFTQVYSKVSLVRKVNRQSFCPSPNVDSAIVKLEFSTPPSLDIGNDDHFFKVVRRAFQKRRKTILNSLSDKKGGVFSKENVTAALEKAGIDPVRRPETLQLQEWAKLSNLLDPVSLRKPR